MSLIPSAIAQTQTAVQQTPKGMGVEMILWFGAMFVIMYFLMIRPQRKRQKELQAIMSALSKGDEVLLFGGLVGKITKVDDTYIVIETGKDVELTFQKNAVQAVLPKGTIKSITAN